MTNKVVITGKRHDDLYAVRNKEEDIDRFHKQIKKYGTNVWAIFIASIEFTSNGRLRLKDPNNVEILEIARSAD
ncbi:hypothetical protein EJ110_NYTH22334 [Nymphaea thermarum]|nr:hypothetical protein EJ110_NYTH22334 [Nymphaea thermarum]